MSIHRWRLPIQLQLCYDGADAFAGMYDYAWDGSDGSRHTAGLTAEQSLSFNAPLALVLAGARC
jgi:hypothetical protein